MSDSIRMNDSTALNGLYVHTQTNDVVKQIQRINPLQLNQLITTQVTPNSSIFLFRIRFKTVNEIHKMNVCVT